MSAMPSLTVNGATHGGGRSRGGSGPGPGSGGLGAAPGVALASPNSTSERMYSAKQLTDALRSGLAAVKEQLQVRGPSGGGPDGGGDEGWAGLMWLRAAGVQECMVPCWRTPPAAV